MNLSYELISNDNIKLAISLQGTIFPGESALQHYSHAIATKNTSSSYYIVKYNDIPVGVTGFYTFEKYDKNPINNDSVWLGWYGILKEFRRNGIGRQVLLDTIEKSKIYNKKYFRLYTVKTDNASAQPLYRSVMETCEIYQNKKDYNYDNNCLIYGFSLRNDEKVELWNNKYAYINEDLKMETLSNKELNKYYKIFITIPENLKSTTNLITLATSIREDGHLVYMGDLHDKNEEYDIIITETYLKTINKLKVDDIKNKIYNQIKEKNNGTNI